MVNQQSPCSRRPLLGAIAIVLVVYILSAVWGGWPQYGARLIADTQQGAVHDGKHELPGEDHGRDVARQPPPYWMIAPFALLLVAIAVLPLVPLTAHWWDSNRNRFLVAAGLGLLPLLYYLFLHRDTIDGHWPVHYLVAPAAQGLNWNQSLTVLANAILNEYVPFIVLLFALYTISGGIRITGDLRAHPLTNTAILAVGGVLASFIGTTGAAMLLIRLLLETNRERKHVAHTVIFFIFIVCNCGGCLLPLGDPPLFLGYLRGVGFLWTLNLWVQWFFVNVLLLVIYLAMDALWHYPKEFPLDVAVDETRTAGMRIGGLWPNALLLAGVVLAVGLLDPQKMIPGTSFRPWMYMREIVQLALVGLSLLLGSQVVRRENNFNYHAIVEVAALFFGIFICMQPALQILGVRGPSLGLDTPGEYFWATGVLSSFLDNAPTYVVFFQTAQSLPAPEGAVLVAGVQETLLIAISLGAVFMGANTYIGNGPNFMVKAIAEHSGVKMPSFFGYMAYSGLILLPIFAITTLIFF